MKKYLLIIQPWTWQCGDGCCSDSGTDVELREKNLRGNIVFSTEYEYGDCTNRVENDSIDGDLIDLLLEKIEIECEPNQTMTDKEFIEFMKKYDIELVINRNFEEER